MAYTYPASYPVFEFRIFAQGSDDYFAWSPIYNKRTIQDAIEAMHKDIIPRMVPGNIIRIMNYGLASKDVLWEYQK